MDKKTEKYIIQSLRRATITWSGRALCLNRGRRKRIIGTIASGKEKWIWENDCEICHKFYALKDNIFEVDHIVEIGPFNGDFDDLVRRMFCEQDNLQRLCIPCHAKKTSNFNSTLRYERKKPKTPVQEIVGEDSALKISQPYTDPLEAL